MEICSEYNANIPVKIWHVCMCTSGSFSLSWEHRSTFEICEVETWFLYFRDLPWVGSPFPTFSHLWYHLGTNFLNRKCIGDLQVDLSLLSESDPPMDPSGWLIYCSSQISLVTVSSTTFTWSAWLHNLLSIFTSFLITILWLSWFQLLEDDSHCTFVWFMIISMTI